MVAPLNRRLNSRVGSSSAAFCWPAARHDVEQPSPTDLMPRVSSGAFSGTLLAMSSEII